MGLSAVGFFYVNFFTQTVLVSTGATTATYGIDYDISTTETLIGNLNTVADGFHSMTTLFTLASTFVSSDNIYGADDRMKFLWTLFAESSFIYLTLTALMAKWMLQALLNSWSAWDIFTTFMKIFVMDMFPSFFFTTFPLFLNFYRLDKYGATHTTPIFGN